MSRKISLELNDIVYDLLQVLDPDGSVERVLEQLIDHAQQGVYRPGAWEREWLMQVFFDDWIEMLEPGDPYGSNGCEDYFQRPKRPRVTSRRSR